MKSSWPKGDSYMKNEAKAKHDNFSFQREKQLCQKRRVVKFTTSFSCDKCLHSHHNVNSGVRLNQDYYITLMGERRREG